MLSHYIVGGMVCYIQITIEGNNFSGFYAPLRSLIIVDFFGLHKLTPVTGMMILFQGIGSFLGAPLAGA